MYAGRDPHIPPDPCPVRLRSDFTLVYVFSSTRLRIYPAAAPAVQTRAVYCCLVVLYFVRDQTSVQQRHGLQTLSEEQLS